MNRCPFRVWCLTCVFDQIQSNQFRWQFLSLVVSPPFELFESTVSGGDEARDFLNCYTGRRWCRVYFTTLTAATIADAVVFVFVRESAFIVHFVCIEMKRKTNHTIQCVAIVFRSSRGCVTVLAARLLLLLRMH